MVCAAARSGRASRPAPLERLIEGRDPATGPLIRRHGSDGTMVGAIDLTVEMLEAGQ
jgi:hypothetical protein